MYIGDTIGRRALYSPGETAVIDYGKSPVAHFTYAQLNNRANQLANWLKDMAGIVQGDRVAILAKDGVEHLDTFFACSKLGAIHTALNWRLHWRELAGILENTSPKVIIYSNDFRDVIKELRNAPETASLQQFVNIDGRSVTEGVRFDVAMASGKETAVSTPSITEKDIAALIFTGGTTGLPKAAQISHRMIAWNTLNTIIHDLHHGDTYLNVFPLFHTGGLFVYTMPLIILGGKIIITKQFDPSQTLDLIEKEQVTVFAGVPTMYQALTQA
ncbi:MAG: acyl--CoA ligase, partial [Chloroflexi bacterium]|nr:acyl--CoA ligase [Chloroflexota bacterium]